MVQKQATPREQAKEPVYPFKALKQKRLGLGKRILTSPTKAWRQRWTKDPATQQEV